MFRRFKGIGIRRTRTFTIRGAEKLARAHEEAKRVNEHVLTYLDWAVRGPLGKGSVSDQARIFIA